MSDQEGISILIPVYNHDVRQLVWSLLQQGKALNIPFEIRCYDDYSPKESKEVNQDLQNNSDVIYKELEVNLGRSKIRNKLAFEAQYSHLLFLDCDSQIPNQNFISNYSKYLSKDIVVGGRIYPENPKSDDYILHWTVGRAKEGSNAIDRAKSPYSSFMSNNFLIKKSIYNMIRMDEALTGYGHEDTKFGYELKRKQIIITHIDNPVIHEQLDDKEAFLSKTKEGIKNFIKLIELDYGKETKLYKAFHFLKRYRLVSLYKLTFRLFEKKIKKNLLSSTPSLKYFDAFKLFYLIKYSENREG